jgi:hypothetical protein
MTFDELLNVLPNGLHDARLVDLHVDYAQNQAVIDVTVDVSSPHGEVFDTSSRAARIRFSDVQFVVIDPPRSESGAYSGLPVIDGGTGHPASAPRDLPTVSDGRFLCWIFIERCNSFVRIAARSAALEWKEPRPSSM